MLAKSTWQPWSVLRKVPCSSAATCHLPREAKLEYLSIHLSFPDSQIFWKWQGDSQGTKDTKDWPRASRSWFESLGRSPHSVPSCWWEGKMPVWGQGHNGAGGKSLTEAKRRRNVTGSRENCLL